MTPRERIRSFITETFFVEDFADDDSFLSSGIIDSTGMLELTLFVETEFAISISDQELTPENLGSVSELVRFIERKALSSAAVAAGLSVRGR
jgi:acyl carrier protein